MTRVLHVITSLYTGGAESMLYKLLRAANRDQFELEVVSLWDKGTFGPKIEALGIPVRTLGVNNGCSPARALKLLRGHVKNFDPDWIQGWMYHGNLAASAASAFSSRKRKLAWNIRHSIDRLSDEKRSTQAVVMAGAAFSRTNWCQTIICNSTIACRQHAKLGYSAKKLRFLPNGFDLEQFSPSIAARDEMRTELNLPRDAFVIGLVQRWHPMKDHANFFAAAKHLADPKIRLLLVGRDIEPNNEELMEMIHENALEDRVILCGERSDIAKVCNAIDILTVSSFRGEGFPNVVGEAMACGVPCAVTDVGEAGLIVGDLGKVVPPKDPEALADGISDLRARLEAEGNKLKTACRGRIVEEYSLERVANLYEEVYASEF
ncbi:MAG: glycosyltransferase [Rhizobiaceae bacterium]